MQENHSFDNYFGTYPGADGIPPGACMPIHPSRGRRPCVRPFRLGDRAGPDLPHDGSTHRAQARGRHMDGFISGVSQGSQLPRVGGHGPLRRARPALLLERRRRVRALRPMVRVLAAAAACPTGWPGWRARPRSRARRSSTGSSGAGSRGSSTWRTTTRAERDRAGGTPDTSAQAVRVPLLNMPRFVHRPRLLRHIVDLDQYYDDLRSGTLPAGRVHRSGRRQRASAAAARDRTDAGALAPHGAGAEPRWPHVGVPVDLRRVGRLVRPRAGRRRAAGSACRRCS